MECAGTFQPPEASSSAYHLPKSVIVDFRLSIFAWQEYGSHSPFDICHVSVTFGGYEIAAWIAADARGNVMPAKFYDRCFVEQTSAFSSSFPPHHENEVTRSIFEIKFDLLFRYHRGLDFDRLCTYYSCGEKCSCNIDNAKKSTKV